jgi:uncharacterized protein (DUF305 family)
MNLSQLSRAFVVGAMCVLASCSSTTTSTQDPQEESTDELNVIDAMFVEMMLPHHEQAIVMSDMALEPSRGASAEVVELAQQIKSVQGIEIALLRDLAERANDLGDDHIHEMKGMLTEDEIAVLGSLSGGEFDRAWLEGMIAHHEGAVEMANDVLRDGRNQSVRTLANEVVKTQLAEIDVMKALLN